MRSPTKLTRSALTAFLLAGLPAAAIAAPPAVLDRVPANADVVIAVQQVNDFLADLDQINRVLGQNANPGLNFATAMVRGMPGMDLDGSAVFVIDLPADPNGMDQPVVVALLPVKDFEALTQGREAVDGVVQLPLPDAEVFARDLGGGHVAVSDNADAVRAFDATKGRLKDHTARVGGAGGRLVSGSEVSIIANADALRPMLDAGLAGMREQGQMVALMGGEQAAVSFNSLTSLVTAAVRDLNAGVLGLTITDAGMTYDMAMQFKPDSESAAYFAAKGSTAGLLEKLPSQRYMFAAALDTSAPTFAKIAQGVEAWTNALPEEMRQQASNFGQVSLTDLSRLSTGTSFVMGTPPGLMGGGLFSNTTQYIRSADPTAYTVAVVESLNTANGQSAQGVTLSTSVTPKAITVDDTAMTAYGVTMQMDPQAMGGGMGMGAVDPTMVTQMIFGPTGGPAGYIATVDGGVVQTLSQGPDLTRRAVAAAKAGAGLGTDERVKRVGANLQEGRFAEIYIGVDEIMNTVGPTLMMFGALPDFQPMDAIDPIGLSLAADSGGFAGRIHLPMSAIKAISTFIPAGAGAPAGGDDQGFDF
tara:strand:- start:857 stop:2617 length:1761 start_codon:yes stop_codon:yes gene_type:complete